MQKAGKAEGLRTLHHPRRGKNPAGIRRREPDQLSAKRSLFSSFDLDSTLISLLRHIPDLATCLAFLLLFNGIIFYIKDPLFLKGANFTFLLPEEANYPLRDGIIHFKACCGRTSLCVTPFIPMLSFGLLRRLLLLQRDASEADVSTPRSCGRPPLATTT